MSTNDARAQRLTRALHAIVDADRAALAEVFSDDVKVWSPVLSASSVSALVATIDGRDDAFSDVRLETSPLDVNGEFACAEWSVTMQHAGVPITSHGVAVAELSDDRICALRLYWDDRSLLEQLGSASEPQ